MRLIALLLLLLLVGGGGLAFSKKRVGSAIFAAIAVALYFAMSPGAFGPVSTVSSFIA